MSIKIYFSASDEIIDQARAFVYSLYKWSPDAKVFFIPYNSNILQTQNFLRQTAVIDLSRDIDWAAYDRIFYKLFPNPEDSKYAGRFRRYWIYEQTGDMRVYMDTDIWTNRDLLSSLMPLSVRGKDFQIAPLVIENDPWVYKSEFRDNVLLAQSKRFSDGFFVLNEEISISLQEILELINENMTIYLDYRAERVYSQPVSNLIVDTKKISCVHLPLLNPEFWGYTWGGEIYRLDSEGVIFDKEGRRPPLVHFSGHDKDRHGFYSQLKSLCVWK